MKLIDKKEMCYSKVVIEIEGKELETLILLTQMNVRIPELFPSYDGRQQRVKSLLDGLREMLTGGA